MPLDDLTPEQEAVVKHRQGPARVRAVAGSGKTTTLVERVLYLLCQRQVAPQRLLVVMYNRAAREDFAAKLQKRAADLQLSTPLPDVRTFHSLGHRLSQTLVRWGYLQPRRLQQEDWIEDRLTRQALKRLAEQLGEEAQPWLEDEAVDAFKSFCTFVKSDLCPAKEVAEKLALPANQQHFVPAFAVLEKLLQEQQVCFFDDLLWRPLQVIQKHPAVKERLQGFLDYLVADEYQDINAVQQALLITLAGKAEVMVVGDVDQCIYQWRGARPDYMLHRFEQDFPGVKDYPLSTTFRFGHSLALAANQVIQHNQERPPQLTQALDSRCTQLQQGQGAGWLLAQLQQWQTQQPQGQAAVLVRSWSQSLAVQLELLKAHQPFQLARQEHFIFNRPQIRGLLAYARLAFHQAPGQRINFHHPEAQADFYQLLSFPSLYLTDAERQQLVAARIQGQGVLDEQIAKLSAVKKKRLHKRLQFLKKIAKKARDLSPEAFLDEVVAQTDAKEQVRKTAATKEAAEEALRLIEELQRFARRSQASLGEWIAELHQAQQEGAASLTQGTANATARVQVLTVHAAKGLEWDWVGIYGLNEGDFPYYSGVRPKRLKGTEEEAERRLFYVAMTRARSVLVLAEGENRAAPSRFLQEASLADALYLAGQLAQENPSRKKQTVAFPQLLEHYWQAVSAHPPPPLAEAKASPSRG